MHQEKVENEVRTQMPVKIKNMRVKKTVTLISAWVKQEKQKLN